MEILRTFLAGLAIGIANIIPGVSGGTLAVVFNIYNKFVNAITLNFKKLWKNKKFVIPLIIGLAAGVLIFSKLITKLYDNFPLQTSYFFLGLIVGSIPLVFKFSFKKKNGEKKFSAAKIVSLVICFLIGLGILIYLGHLEGIITVPEAAEVLPSFTPALAIRMFIAGIVGAIAMIIPGISGSLLFLILGVYTIIMKSISSILEPGMLMNSILLLAPCAVGIIVGLLGGAKLISILLKKIPNQTYAIILGLICGSAVAVFPGFHFASTLHTAICFICFVAGVVIAFISTKFAPKE